MRLSSLRLRLLLAGGAFVIVAVAVAALGLSILYKSHVEDWIDGQLNAHLDQLIAGIDAGPDGTITVAKPPADPRFEQPLSGFYWQVDVEPSGPVFRSRSLWDYEIALPQEGSLGDTIHHHLVAGPGGQTLYLQQRRVKLPARLGGKTVRAAVGLNDAEVRASVWRFAAVLVPSLLILGALLSAAALMQVAYGLRPLGFMRARLSDIGSGAIRRLGTGFPKEVQPLAREIDALLDARDQQVAQARARASDLAHGLKTPLQALAGETARMRAKGETELAAEVEEIAGAMQRHVDRHLARARLAGTDPNATANVGDVVRRIVRVMERTAKGESLHWRVDVPEGLIARIDESDLTEALGNLAENAVRHTRTLVAIAARRAPGTIIVTISDDGPGIPPELQQVALQRGRRLDVSGPGAGLGLAIVGDIAEAWGATLAFDKKEGNFDVALRIPSVPVAT